MNRAFWLDAGERMLKSLVEFGAVFGCLGLTNTVKFELGGYCLGMAGIAFVSLMVSVASLDIPAISPASMVRK